MNTAHRNRSAAGPAYYLGRSADIWQTALRRQRHRSHHALPTTPTTPTTRDRRLASPHGATQ
jgi:hypothetical protein